jgi:hypothetical protein
MTYNNALHGIQPCTSWHTIMHGMSCTLHCMTYNHALHDRRECTAWHTTMHCMAYRHAMYDIQPCTSWHTSMHSMTSMYALNGNQLAQFFHALPWLSMHVSSCANDRALVLPVVKVKNLFKPSRMTTHNKLERFLLIVILSQVYIYSKLPFSGNTYKLFQYSLMFVGKARNLPKSEGPEKCFTLVGSCLSLKN